MKPLPVSKQNEKVQTFGSGFEAEEWLLMVVHVSARASAENDLRNLERVRRIMSWESARKITIYPPPEIRLGTSRGGLFKVNTGRKHSTKDARIKE